MANPIRPIKCDPEKGQFILRVDSMSNEVIRQVVDKLRNEYRESAMLQHLIWSDAHPDYAALVVTPSGGLASGFLRPQMQASMVVHLRQVLRSRARARQSLAV